MRLMRMSICVVAVTCCVAVSTASAQVCTGRSARNADLLNALVGMTFVPGAHDLHGRAGAAGRHLFGGVRLSGTTYDHEDVNAFAAGVDLGAVLPLNAPRTLVLCPSVDWLYKAGPNTVSYHKQSHHVLATGLSAGRQFELSDEMVLLPYATGSLQWVRSESRFFGAEGDPRISTGGYLVAGSGLQWRSRYLLRASVGRPVGVSNADFALTVGLGASFRSWNPYSRGSEIKR